MDSFFLLLAEVPITPEEAMGSYEGAFLKMFLTLIALLVAIFFAAWALRKLAHGRLMQFNNSKNIKILEKRALSPKTALYLIEVHGRKTVIAESQLEVKKIITFPPEKEAPE